jgi:hypothetical protein
MQVPLIQKQTRTTEDGRKEKQSIILSLVITKYSHSYLIFM